MENRTSIIISHRVSSAKLADQIIVLDEGRIVERGDHASLLAQKGVYATLFEKQTQGGESIEEIKIWSSIKWVLSTANSLLSTADSSGIKLSIQILARF